MDDLEQRVRRSLAVHAGSPTSSPMPAGTRARVRAREGVLVGAIALITALAVVGAVAVVRVLPRWSDRPATADAVTSPLEHVPPGWPAVDVVDPATAEPPTIDAPYVYEGPRALVVGTVDGSAFSLWAWMQGAGGGHLCIGLVGPEPAGLPLEATSVQGGCVRNGLPDADLVAFASAGDRTDLTATFGLLHDRVAEVWAGVPTGGSVELPLLRAPLGDGGVRAFLMFPPSSEGRVEAYGPGGLEHGTPLATASLCDATVESGCAPRVSQLTPTSSDPAGGIEPPAPGEWPETVLGGDFEPYVDHVMDEQGVLDPGIVTPKTPIIWGTVQGVPFSVTAFKVDGWGDWTGSGGPDGEPGPAGELFLGALGVYGGVSLALNADAPWQPNDLGMDEIGFGSGPLTAYAGVVSERVAAVEFRFADGQTRSVDLVPGPDGVKASYFILWAPNDLGGEVVALAEDGATLERRTLCLPAADLESDAISSCG